jgi:hypothetical protein
MLDYQFLLYQLFFPLCYGGWGLISGVLSRHAAYLGSWGWGSPVDPAGIFKRLVVMPEGDGLEAEADTLYL